MREGQLLRKTRRQRFGARKLNLVIIDDTRNFADNTLAAAAVVVLGYLKELVMMMAKMIQLLHGEMALAKSWQRGQEATYTEHG